MTSEDSEKIRELYEIYEQPMFRIAYAVLHDSALAEDAVSDAFIRIIGKLDRLKAPDSPKTKQYIVKTIKSTSINIYRKTAACLSANCLLMRKPCKCQTVSKMSRVRSLTMSAAIPSEK